MYYDLFTVFESVIWLYRILGCYPYVLREYDDARKYILSPFSVTFNILLFIIGTKYFVVYADTVINNYDLNSDSLGIMTLGVRQFSNMICVFDSTIVKIFHSGKILRSINSLYSVDEELKNLGYHFNYRLAVRTVPICLIAFLTSMYLFINTEFLLLVDLPIPSLMRLFGNSMILLQMANITLFSFLITNVGFRLKALNASLENLTDHPLNFQVIMVNNKKPEDIVHTSAKIHARLCEVAKLLNGAFVLTIVTSVVQAFVISTAMLYFIFIEFKTGLANEFLIMMPYLTMLLICVLVVLVIVLSCNWTSSQIAGTAKILHQMSLKKMCMDDKSLDEMRKKKFQLGKMITLAYDKDQPV
ncbi:uncharacterized protein LOC106646153 [Copidosoma floridanum]|uniref:uncharacterized protein LOC106646153 n=1 Tax=Copidosoma floridanum TaxID=29053 RepID=UPI000C6F9D23|nr:uncharacterized protein LOC106646153 [Copidosoma floridanum]